MSRLDEELAEAVEQSEQAEPAVVADTGPSESRKPQRSIGLLAALLVMVGAALWLVFTSFDDAAIYSKTVDQLVAERDELAKRNVRVEGDLVKGTLVRREEPCEYRFRIGKNGKEIDVHFPQCVVPDTFRDMPGMDVAVTAEGKLHEDGYFLASNIMAKCPSKYEMKERQAKGEKAPHAEVTGPSQVPVAPEATN